MIVGHVDHGPLERFVTRPVDLPNDDLGTAHLELVPLTPHRLDEDRELELAATGDLDDVGRIGLLEADRHVAQHLAVEALAQVSGGEELPLLAGER